MIGSIGWLDLSLLALMVLAAGIYVARDERRLRRGR